MDDLLISIQWILYAKRPLTREEFYFGVVSGLYPEQAQDPWNPDYITTDTMTRFVLSSSKGLAEVTKSKNETIQFIHESVRDFLIKDNGLRDLWPDLAEDFLSMSHERLKQCCHNYTQTDISSYITFDKALPKANSVEARDLRQIVSGKFPFLQYATNNIMYHADMAATGVPQDTFLQTFDPLSWISLNNIFEKYEVRRYTPSASLLYILAETNMAKLIKSVLHSDPYALYKQGERYKYPIFAAIVNGHRGAVEVLLESEDSPAKDDIIDKVPYQREDVSLKGQGPLSWSVEKGQMEIVQLLLERGAEIDEKSISGKTPLLWAAGKGHKEIVQLVL